MKRTKYACLLVASALLLCTPLSAQAAAAGEDAATADTDASDTARKLTLTVQDAVQLAESSSRTLKSAEIDIAMKERASKYGWNVLLPTLQLSTTLARTTDMDSTIESANSTIALANALASLQEGAPQTEPLKDTESLHWAAVGTASVSWNFSLAMIQQIKAAKASYEGGKISLEQSQREVTTQIKKLFYALLLQQEALKIQQVTLENSRQRMTQAQTNYRNGAVPELSLLQAQVTYQNMVPDVEQAAQSLQQQLDTFAFLLGAPVGTEITLVGEIEPNYIEADVDTLLAQYGGNNLDIQSLRNNIETLKMNLAAVNLSTWTPALNISYSWQPTLAPYALDFDKWSNGDNWKDGGSLSFTLAWNITNMLPWSTNRQQAKDLQANIDKLEITMETLLENQKIEVRSAVNTLNQARAQIEAMGRNVSVAQRAYDMTMRSYRNGATELLDVRDAESSLNQAKLGQLQQKFNYLSALMDLEKALNVGLSQPPAAAADAENASATSVP